MDTVARLRALIEPLVTEAGAALYDLEYTDGVLRVTVQKAEGVDIGTIGKVTRAISRMLDEEDPIPSEYTLEVSSPGLERALRRPEHFTGAIGSVVALKLRAGVEGDRRVKGTLLEADETSATIAPAGADPGASRVIDLSDIDRARTVFEWGPAPKPGTGSKPGAPPKSSTTSKKKAARS